MNREVLIILMPSANGRTVRPHILNHSTTIISSPSGAKAKPVIHLLAITPPKITTILLLITWPFISGLRTGAYSIRQNQIQRSKLQLILQDNTLNGMRASVVPSANQWSWRSLVSPEIRKILILQRRRKSA